MLIDVSASVVLLGILLVLAVQLLAWRASDAPSVERRRWALAEARNVVERVASLPADSLTDPALAALGLEASAQAALPEGQVEVRLQPQTDVAGLVRIDVVVSWREKAGRESVRLARFTAPGTDQETRP
jgi:hypothetical protein